MKNYDLERSQLLKKCSHGILSSTMKTVQRSETAVLNSFRQLTNLKKGKEVATPGVHELHHYVYPQVLKPCVFLVYHSFIFCHFLEIVTLNSEMGPLMVLMCQNLCALAKVQQNGKLRQMLLHTTWNEIKALIQLQQLLRQDLKTISLQCRKVFFHSNITYSNNSGVCGLYFSIINTTTISENIIAKMFFHTAIRIRKENKPGRGF